MEFEASAREDIELMKTEPKKKEKPQEEKPDEEEKGKYERQKKEKPVEPEEEKPLKIGKAEVIITLAAFNRSFIRLYLP
jgi:hypothetical protein